MKKPSFQFYPGDWRKDQNLSRASLAAKGALIEILCLAFECEKRGMLKTGKKPWTIDEIAFAIGGDKQQNILAIEELLDKKILKKDKKNTIFSSRMVKDEKLSKVRREAGLKGGNPNLVNQKSNQKTTPSASSSTSVYSNSTKEDRVPIQRNSTTEANKLSADLIFEKLRMATSANAYSDRQIHEETVKFIDRYKDEKIRNLGAVIYEWARNMKPEKRGLVV